MSILLGWSVEDALTDCLSVWIMLLSVPHYWLYPSPCNDTVLFSLPRFMESELDLNDIIQEMHVVATMPDLYHLLVELNAVQSLLGLLGHDNTDILSDLSSVGRRTDVVGECCLLSSPVCLCWCLLSRLVVYFHSNYLPSWNTRCFFYSFGSLVFNLLINLGQPLIVLFAVISIRIHRDVSVLILTALIFQDLDLGAHYIGNTRQDLHLLI